MLSESQWSSILQAQCDVECSTHEVSLLEKSIQHQQKEIQRRNERSIKLKEKFRLICLKSGISEIQLTFHPGFGLQPSYYSTKCFSWNHELGESVSDPDLEQSFHSTGNMELCAALSSNTNNADIIRTLQKFGKLDRIGFLFFNWELFDLADSQS